MTSDRDRERAYAYAVERAEFDTESRLDAMRDYLAGLAAGRAEALTWSSEPPTVEGLYFWRLSSEDKGIELRSVWSDWIAEKLKEFYPHCQFAGPLPLPQEPPR